MKNEIILADPPWMYRDKANAGKRGAGYKYACITIGELGALEPKTIAAPDCALFLWATFPLLTEALWLINKWGFKYRTVAFTWVKTNKVSKSYAFGMGNWTRSNAEVCLLATIGKPKRVNAGVQQIVQAPRLKHSAKPPKVRERIVKLMGDRPRIELFARDKAPGWEATGLELDGRDIREFLDSHALKT